MNYDRNEYLTGLTKIGDQVEYVLEHYPETRSSDRKLEVRVWELFYGVVMLRDLIKKRVPPSSGIRRWRRRIQGWGRWLPTAAEQKHRKHNEYYYTKEFTDRRAV